jgi:SAM-dependent methyltransferase
MHEAVNLHRKLWEYCFIAQGLFERGMLRPGRRGLGFGVGQEPLVALFAGYGCDLLATDVHPDAVKGLGWIETGQHSTSLRSLNERGICDPDAFAQRVQFRYLDMNKIPRDLEGFDFVWSCCALEHLGSIARGKKFILNALKCLRPGGVAIHTTEFNLSSRTSTLYHRWTALFGRRDIEKIVRVSRRRGFKIEVDYSLGCQEADQFVDVPPYKHSPHIRFQLGKYVATSIGLIFERPAPRV